MDGPFYENTLNHLGEAVFVLDREGSIVYVNDYLLQHGILTKAETLASNSNSLFQGGQTDINIYQMVLERKQTITALQTITSAGLNQRSQAYLVTQTPIMDEHGEVEWIVGVIRDIASFQHTVYQARQADDHTYTPSFPVAPALPGQMERPVYQSKCMEALFQAADTIAPSSATVLVLGESGVGKEVVATYLHRVSPRSAHKMVAINCAALQENLLESELFGYEKGAFTGAAVNGKKGLIELAHGSTLFLDEVDSLPLPLQAKLLRVLETHEVRPLGGHRDVAVDFRVIAATNADLEARVAHHQFREDLFYRLNVLPLTIPPLRKRPEDIPPLVRHFLEDFERKYGRSKAFSPAAMAKLTAYPWPGNVRELRNLIERLVLMTDTSVWEIKDIPDILFSHSCAPLSAPTLPEDPFDSGLREGVTLKAQVEAVELRLIDAAIARYGSYSKAARALGLSKSTLIRKRNRQQK